VSNCAGSNNARRAKQAGRALERRALSGSELGMVSMLKAITREVSQGSLSCLSILFSDLNQPSTNQKKEDSHAE
jgi:hypothetical protein